MWQEQSLISDSGLFWDVVILQFLLLRDPYLSHRRLILEQSPIAARQIAHLVVRDVLNILNVGTEQLVLQQTRIGKTVAR